MCVTLEFLFKAVAHIDSSCRLIFCHPPSDYDIKKTGVTTHFPELRTLDRLRQGLSDQYVIYHGVHWAKAKESASVYGEIDFIVLSPYGQMLAIEQK
ncbi:MAG: NERD domain-containing protein, partial [Betaproteobacteria bacterium]|nr:NERD domain-containing protein [Betaproteobacteria bacterium]